jgi:toxin secretion/phage lysis holin
MTPAPLPYPGIPIPWALQQIFHWFEGQPVLSGLIVLMVIDVLVGICLSIVKKTLSSTVSWRGMSKKAIMILIIGAAGVLQPFLPQIPILNIVSAFYTLTEALSILENAAAAGVPLPAGLIATLSKLQQDQRLARAQKDPGTTTNISVTTMAASQPIPAPIDVDGRKGDGI